MPRSTSLLNKLAYFQGGGGVNEPTPGQKKYPSDKAIVVQPRFKEPFYRNYDYMDSEGVDGEPVHGPGSGWNHMTDHKSVQDFLEFRRKRLHNKYVAEDSWIEDSLSNYKERVNNMKIRADLLHGMVKTAYHMPEKEIIEAIRQSGDENDGPNFDYGDGAYTAMSEGKKMKDITDAPHKSPGAFFADDNDLGTGFYENLEKYKSVRDFIEHTPLGYDHGAKIKPEWERAKHPDQKDINHIDFPIDDMVNRQCQMIYPEEGEYQFRREKGDRYDYPSEGDSMDPGELNISLTTPQIAGEHTYLPNPDFEGKSDNGSQLDFGRDYTEEDLPGRQFDFADADDEQMDLDELEAKYLESAEVGLFGLPDGVDPEGHDSDQTIQIERPYDTISDVSREMYEDKWNI
jgi:hypothetical protein